MNTAAVSTARDTDSTGHHHAGEAVSPRTVVLHPSLMRMGLGTRLLLACAAMAVVWLLVLSVVG